MRESKMWNELSMKEKADIIKVGVKHGIANLADIRAKYNEFALEGNLYDEGGPKTRYTADGRTLHYSIVPSTREVRWIDFDDSKDFDGVTGYRFYDNAGNKMHYTQWQDNADYLGIKDATGYVLPEVEVLGKDLAMRAHRHLDDPLLGGELKNNQYTTMPAQSHVDDYADMRDAQVVPHMGDFVSAATKPLDVLMPSRWVGLLDKDYDGLSAVDRFSRLFDENNRGLFINDKPYGLFSKRYAEEHPYWAMAGNMAGDVLIGLGMKKTLDLSKNLYHSVIREPIPFSEKQAAAQRMNDFIHSADYIHKQKQAGLTDTEISDFQDMVARRLNSGDFPAYYSRINADGMSIALPKPIGGIYMKRGLSPEDFLNAFDHEAAHYSTVNFGKSGNPYNKLARLVNKENPTTIEKMMDYNSGIVPLRPKSDALKIRKDRGLKTDATWLNKPKSQILLDYFQNDQAIRSNAYAIVQDAERRGMSVDDYIDFCTSPGGEIYRAAPTPIKYLNYVFTPENMKKFLKGFLSISAPAILTTNKTNKDEI